MSEIAEVFLEHQRGRLRDLRGRLAWAIGQMSDEDVNWRPNEESNSVANLVLHIEGNIGERYVAALDGGDYARHRDLEFSSREPHTVAGLLERLEAAFTAADAALGRLTPARLLERHEVRGRQAAVLELVSTWNSHYAEHLGQVLYVAKLRLGPRYKVAWEPPKAP